jgi:mono/diheme cytochrome c family protein
MRYRELLGTALVERSSGRHVPLVSAVLMCVVAGCGQTTPPVSQQADRSATRDAAVEAPLASTATIVGTSSNLYLQHCAACHGEKGDGQGIAARFLFPKPRDFRAGRFRLVSTTNGVPTEADIEAVLKRGMPGSAMLPWSHLKADELRQLTKAVLEFRQAGARDVELQLATDNEETLSDEELDEAVALVTTPGEVFAVPEFPDASPESIAHGKDVYLNKGCAQCHGAGGKGDGQQAMIDSEGIVSRPRDLTQGIYKGSPDFASVYRRVRLGLPGSPMPASQNLTDEEVAHVSQFVLSLSDEEIREANVIRRREIRASAGTTLPELPNDPVWDSVPAVGVQTTPLWWRDAHDAGLQVQALHDGQVLAVRLSWNDVTPNTSAVRADEFEDMVALELYEGPAEPFLGMGAPGAPIDLWQWRAGTKETGSADQLSDEYPFDTPIYRELFPNQELPDFVTARVVGNPLARREHSAANLGAQGPGSTTFRPEPSQLVTAFAQHGEGRWAVVLRRPLTAGSSGGLALRPGARYSAAFAIWDGAVHDRAAQKLVSIWNDFYLDGALARQVNPRVR